MRHFVISAPLCVIGEAKKTILSGQIHLLLTEIDMKTIVKQVKNETSQPKKNKQ